MEKSCKKGDNVIVKIYYSAISTACMSGYIMTGHATYK